MMMPMMPKIAPRKNELAPPVLTVADDRGDDAAQQADEKNPKQFHQLPPYGRIVRPARIRCSRFTVTTGPRVLSQCSVTFLTAGLVWVRSEHRLWMAAQLLTASRNDQMGVMQRQ